MNSCIDKIFKYVIKLYYEDKVVVEFVRRCKEIDVSYDTRIGVTIYKRDF